MENGATDMVGLNHGNSWSVYFDDPENNKVEVYVDTPFHTPQPCGEPLNLDLSEADLLAETKALVDALPEGQSREAYIQTMADRFSSRSEERRGGKDCVSTCRSRWAPCH